MGETSKPLLIMGPTGSGKSTRLLEIYKQLIAEGEASDHVQVLVLNRQQVAWWKEHVDLSRGGFLRIDTYFSFVCRELRRFWHVLENCFTSGQPVLEPVFLTMETAQYMMELCIEEMRRQGKFLDERFRSHPTRMALQLTETMQIAAISRLDAREIASRLKNAWGEAGPATTIYDDIYETIELYRQRCFAARTLDYALSLELYNTVLLQHPEYQRYVREAVRHVVIDDTEEILPAALEWITQLLPYLQSASFAYCTDGGHSIFFGAHPELARLKLMPLCRIEQLGDSRTSAERCSRWGDALSARILQDRNDVAAGNAVIRHIAEDLRGSMIRQTADAVLELLDKGVAPADIVVVTPNVDLVLEHSLRQTLRRRGCCVQNTSRSRRLIDLPYVSTMMTLLKILHPHWHARPSTTDVSHMVSLLLELDPIRSTVLAEYILGYGWVELQERGMRERIGYASAAHYDFLRQRFHCISPEGSIADVIQQIFTQLLYPSGPSAEDIDGCRQLVQSARHFEQFASRFFPSDKIGWHFISMVEKGTVAADRRDDHLQLQAVRLSTAYALLMDKGRSHAYQLWLDTSRDAWYRSDAKELTNPHVLSQRWQDGEVWTDAINERLRKEKIARTVKTLARRCRSGIIVAESACDSYGSEREGELAAHIAELETSKEIGR
jgi:hypothetical protein